MPRVARITIPGVPHHVTQRGNNRQHVFFPGDDSAMNHPDPGAGSTPNWYYYWEQTSATYGTHDYNGTYEQGYTAFSAGAWHSHIGYGGNNTSAAGTWSSASGIDYYANYCRHEERHRLDFIDWWGAGNDRVAARDPDGDWIPTDDGGTPPGTIEANYSCSGVSYNPNQKLTTNIQDHFNYGPGFSDREDFCLHREQSWTNGSANSVDWSDSPYPKQY